ncbi:hypothetical protein JXB02_02050 [Candidatus Woesearchaeota archaeon]|nr:hypothetical protein [Candidatus Woesearchaeota archaeon]
MEQSYLLVLVLIVINFISVLAVMAGLPAGTFVRELFLVLCFLVLAAVALYAISRRKVWSWMLAEIFFGVNLVNTIFLYTISSPKSGLLIIATVVNVWGFVHAINRVDAFKRERRTLASYKTEKVIHDLRPLEEAQRIIDEIKEQRAEEKKAANKPAPAKRKPTKKPQKAPAKRAPAKRRSRKK